VNYLYTQRTQVGNNEIMYMLVKSI